MIPGLDRIGNVGKSFLSKKMATCFCSEVADGLAINARSYPAEYVSLISRKYVPETYEHYSYFFNKWRHVSAKPAHYDETFKFNPRIILEKLWSGGKGTGTKAVQNVVWGSLKNPRTRGRVCIDACCIDGKTAPGAFYYKLGFRFTNPADNEICEKWLLSGGKRENAPFMVGNMFLPRENIEHCLKYGLSSNEIAQIKPELDFYKAAGLIQ